MQQIPKSPNKLPSDKSVFRSFMWAFAIFVLLAVALSLYRSPIEQQDTSITINELARLVQDDKVKSITVSEGSKLVITLSDDTEKQSFKEVTESLATQLATYGVTPEQLQNVNVSVEGRSGWKVVFIDFLPVLLPFIFIVVFFVFMARQVQGANNRAMGFGQMPAKFIDPNKQRPTATFADVAGATEAKEELVEVVEFLKEPEKFLALGAKIPKGVLLMGPPGTGKTLLARAVAGEAKVPFFYISGSEFVEMFVGVGASRVRDFFRRAKKVSPAIVFIDEIDAVGRQRGTGLGGSHDEREQTLNQILTEMDGFEVEDNVIVIAATNRADVLDPALLRPGRFDRRVILDLPDVRDREEILGVHARNKSLAEDVDLKTLAQRTTGFSGADLMNLLNEAAIFAARRGKNQVEMAECLESIDKVLLGPQRKSARFSDEEKRITAYHEAGHALVAHLLPESDPVHKVTIIPRGRAGGYTLKMPDDDRKLHTRKGMLADIAVSLGGYVAELLKFGDLTTGPSNDLEKATKMARQIVMRFGMTDALGPRTFGETSDMVFLGKEIHEQRDYSDKTAEIIDNEINRIIHEQHTLVQDLIQQQVAKLDLIANRLLEVETLEREQFEALLAEPTTTV